MARHRLTHREGAARRSRGRGTAGAGWRAASATAAAALLCVLPACSTTPLAAPAGGQSLGDLAPGTRVEIDGVLGPDGEVIAQKVTIEAPAEHSEVKGTVAAIDPAAQVVTIPPFAVQFTETTDIDDEAVATDSYRFEELQVGWHLEVELDRLQDGTLIAVDVSVDKVPDDDRVGLVEIEGVIDEIRGASDAAERTALLLGVPCRIGEQAPLVLQGGSTGSRRQANPPRDEDDFRGVALLTERVGSTEVIVGGELQFQAENRVDYALDEDVDEDIATGEAQATIEVDWRFTEDIFTFLKATTGYAWVFFDNDRDLELGEDTRIVEGYGYWQYIAGLPIAAQVGRQRFDDPREWYYDEEIDGARLIWFSGPFEVEYSVSAFLRDNHLRDEITNQIVAASWEYAPRSRVTLHVIDIVDDSALDDSPFFLGVSAVGRWRSEEHAVRYWGQVSHVDGVDGAQEISGEAVDLGAALQWREVRLSPYLFGGYAWGSGDDDTTGNSSDEYRQTGYQDNNDKVFGVASYRYYGELFRPELSNMHIWTGGVGIRPLDWFSLDLVYHRYSQDVSAPTIRDSRLRADPDGNDADLGQEIDLVFGFDKLWGRWDLELIYGHFIPGDAFETTDDPADWFAAQVELNF